MISATSEESATIAEFPLELIIHCNPLLGSGRCSHELAVESETEWKERSRISRLIHHYRDKYAPTINFIEASIQSQRDRKERWLGMVIDRFGD